MKSLDPRRFWLLEALHRRTQLLKAARAVGAELPNDRKLRRPACPQNKPTLRLSETRKPGPQALKPEHSFGPLEKAAEFVAMPSSKLAPIHW